MPIKRVPDEKGYALVSVLLVSILIFSIATILLFITSNSSKKTVVRDDLVQAQELSEKGLKHILSQITTELDDAIAEEHGKVKKEDFLKAMNDILNTYTCSNTKVTKLKDTDGEYEACITDIGDKDELLRDVVFLSKGEQGEQEKEVETTIKIGADDSLRALNYAVNVPKSKKCHENKRNCFDGEGNVLLHGASDIRGNMRVDGDIGTTAHGRVSRNRVTYWVPTYLPSIRPVSGVGKAELALDGDLYRMTRLERVKSNEDYAKHSSVDMSKGVTGGAQFIQSNNAINQVFHETPRIVEGESKIDEVEINKTINEATNTSNTWSSLHLYNESYTSDERRPTKVRGDLRIGNFSNDKEAWVNLRNTLYVEGDLHVKYADLRANSLIYVKGDVVIEESRINTLKNNQNEDGTLFIFSEGTIRLVNNSLHENTPSIINGFFYANSAVEIYGASSNIFIKGGLSANRLIFNAVRGKTSRNPYGTVNKKYGSAYYQEVYNQGNQSRLTVEYDPDIIQKHHSLTNDDEEYVTETLPPTIIERE